MNAPTQNITKLSQLFQAARDWLANPKHWTKGHYAKDENGNPTDPYPFNRKRIACTCALGAMLKVDPDQYIRLGVSNRLRDYIPKTFSSLSGRRAAQMRHVHRFNDAPTTTHQDVLDLFDRAIAGEQKKEALA